MAYDYQKVQAWLTAVPRDGQSPLWLWLECLEGLTVSNPGELRRQLLDTFRTSTTWERGNMLHGLRDIIAETALYDVKCFWQQARREDDHAQGH